jgi:EAL domain-containing protein (putative c-di-GMP-specific phosphodiesterase class I)/FixJ family two-component response regulator
MTQVLLLADENDRGLLGETEGVYDLTWVGAYDQAKAAFEKDEHDLYLIDSLFAGGRGVNLAQAAARRGTRPVIILTRRPDANFEAKVLARGVADVLVRPELTPVEVDRAIRHAMARSARERRIDRSDMAGSTVALPSLEFRLQNAVARARRSLGGAAVLAIQCDVEGQPSEGVDPGLMALLQGDTLERLRSCLRDVDTVSRVQNTLFALIEDDNPRFLAAHVADRLLSEMALPIQARGKPLRLRPSVGVSVYPGDGEDAETLMTSARQALDRAVAEGGNAFRFPTMPATGLAARRVALERTLERATEQEEFTIVYQPQVSVSTGDVVGAEALIRWSDPELGVVHPSEFIPILESANLIEEVGEWMLRQACIQAKQWDRDGFRIKMSVNVSARQFILGDVVGVVRQTLADTGLDPRLLTLELTEGVMLDSTPEVRAALTELRQLGLRIAIDDFGTGYASLRYVKHFPMDIVKIDKEFVKGLPLNIENAAITNAILALAHSLGLEVVAEGVENEAEAEFLRDLRCTTIQGYLHGRPMDAETFTEWHQGLRARTA